jgi:hypothetical protein
MTVPIPNRFTIVRGEAWKPKVRFNLPGATPTTPGEAKDMRTATLDFYLTLRGKRYLTVPHAFTDNTDYNEVQLSLTDAQTDFDGVGQLMARITWPGQTDAKLYEIRDYVTVPARKATYA